MYIFIWLSSAVKMDKFSTQKSVLCFCLFVCFVLFISFSFVLLFGTYRKIIIEKYRPTVAYLPKKFAFCISSVAMLNVSSFNTSRTDPSDNLLATDHIRKTWNMIRKIIIKKLNENWTGITCWKCWIQVNVWPHNLVSWKLQFILLIACNLILSLIFVLFIIS